MTKMNINQTFEKKRMRHYMNGELSVLHCHHYSTLFSQLALDAKLLKGTTLLLEAAEESLIGPLEKYFAENKVASVEDKVAVAEDYFRVVGLGEVKISFGADGGSAEMLHAHVDDGWLKKWGKHDQPVNYIGQGYLAAAFSAIAGTKAGTYQVEETESIVKGAKSSKFAIKKK